MNISVVISAYNEEKFIGDCLKSVKWADEIILIDNQSSDRTVQIAKKYTNKIFTRKNNPLMLNVNKNFGFSKANSEWILSLDADERINPELKEEILKVIKNNNQKIDGYLIPRKNIIFGKWIQHGLWYPDYQLRLFRRGKGKFPGIHNHELLKVDGDTEKLKGNINHLNYTSINQYLNKITYYYSDNEAKILLDSGKKIKWFDAIRMPASDFFTNFFARKGYKDGLHGLVLALLQAFYTLIVFAKVWEKQGFWEYNDDRFLDKVKTEVEAKEKELSYWINKEEVETSKFPKNILLKIRSKLLS